MKLAISTLPCREWTIEKTLSLCSLCEIEAIEYRLNFHNWNISELKETLKKYNMKVSNLGSSVVISRYEKRQVDEFSNALVIANEINARGIRVFLGSFYQRFSEMNSNVDYFGILKCLAEIADLAKENGKEVWIETHNEFSTGKLLKKLLCDLNKVNVKIIWDIIHPIEQGESIYDTFCNIGEYISHIHIKDGRPQEDSDLLNYFYTKLGDGVLPIREVIELVEKSGYSGYYSLEWESAWRNEINNEEGRGEFVIPEFSPYIKSIIKGVDFN